MAPKVSLKYWNKCILAHRKNLLDQINDSNSASSSANIDARFNPVEEYVEYSILAGEVQEAAMVLEKQKLNAAAKNIKFTQLAGGFPENKA